MAVCLCADTVSPLSSPGQGGLSSYGAPRDLGHFLGLSILSGSLHIHLNVLLSKAHSTLTCNPLLLAGSLSSFIRAQGPRSHCVMIWAPPADKALPALGSPVQKLEMPFRTPVTYAPLLLQLPIPPASQHQEQLHSEIVNYNIPIYD